MARLSSRTTDGDGAGWPEAGVRAEGLRAREENLVERDEVERSVGENM